MTDQHPTTLLTEIERDLLDGRPVADVLRKLIVLGGRAGSSELRDWASRELRGYEDLPSLPEYRQIPAPIQMDAIVGNAVIKGQTISPSGLPEVAREHITNKVPFFKGIGEIEAMAEVGRSGTPLHLSVPGEQELARLIDNASGNPFQHINNIYWTVTSAALDGLVDQVKTRLAELLAELRAVTPASADLPTAAQATNAVNIVIRGQGNRIQIAQAEGEAISSAKATAIDQTADGPFWTLGRRIGALVVGLATVAAAVFAGIQIWG